MFAHANIWRLRNMPAGRDDEPTTKVVTNNCSFVCPITQRWLPIESAIVFRSKNWPAFAIPLRA